MNKIAKHSFVILTFIFVVCLVFQRTTSYCWSEKRYLRDDEFIKAAIDDFIKNPIGQYYAIGDDPLFSDAEHFLNENPNCCSFSLPDPERFEWTRIKRTISDISNFVRIEFPEKNTAYPLTARHLDENVHIYPVTSCGEVYHIR